MQVCMAKGEMKQLSLLRLQELPLRFIAFQSNFSVDGIARGEQVITAFFKPLA